MAAMLLGVLIAAILTLAVIAARFEIAALFVGKSASNARRKTPKTALLERALAFLYLF
ncbi:hypothetical protein ABIB82_006427 [Bradyrhizobium sp. i1.8.4]